MEVLHIWLQRVCAQIHLNSIIYAIESSIMYIQNVLNIFTFRYCPEFCVPHAYYIYTESLLIY